MFKISINTRVLLFRFLLRTISILPFSLRSAAGFGAGFVFSFLPLRDRKTALLQLRRFLPEHANWRTIALTYGRIGQNALESLNLEPVLRNPDRCITAHGLEIGRKFVEEGRGIIALTAHTGNWDLLAAYIIRKGFTLYTAGREVRNPALQELLAELRAKYDIKMLWRSDASVQKSILRALRDRSVVAALIDQDTRVSGRCVPFFGRPAFTPTGLAEIGKRSGAGVVTAFIVRTSFLKFEVFVEPVDADLSAEETAAEFNRRLENILRSRPSQWVWFHKRWRTLPDGRRLSSREYISLLESEIRDAENRKNGGAAGHNPDSGD